MPGVRRTPLPGAGVPLRLVVDVLGDERRRVSLSAKRAGRIDLSGRSSFVHPDSSVTRVLYDDCRTLAYVRWSSYNVLQVAVSTQLTEEIAHPQRAEIELAAVLHALSDPVRLKIVAALADADGEYTCGSFDVPVTKSTCTHHFKVLREAGVIHQRQEGTTRLNTLRRDDLEIRFPGLLATILQAASAR
jgi:DNA-binding transcriptional ArsR family regulator